MYFGFIDYAILLVYLVAMVAMGVWFARGQKDEEDYFHGGGNMHWLLVGLSMLATGFSGISFVGIVGYVFKFDSRLLIQTAFYLAFIPLALWMIPHIYKRIKYISIYEFLEKRFNAPLRMIASVLFMLNKFFWMSVAFLAAGLVLGQATGQSVPLVLAMIGICVTILTMFGGMKGVVWTDAIQSVIVIGGVLVILFALLNPTSGNLSEIWDYAGVSGKIKFYDFTMDLSQPGVFVLFISTLAAYLGNTPSDQVSIQRYVSTGSSREASKSYILSMFCSMAIVVTIYIIAMLLYGFYGTGAGALPEDIADEPDRVLPFFILSELPVGVRGLLIAAITAATASTATSVLNSLSAVTMGDIYDKFAGKDASPSRRITISRIITALWGVLAIGFSIGIYKFPIFGVIGEAAPKLMGLAGASLGGLFLLGLFTKRTNTFGAVCGCVVGTATVAWLLFVVKEKVHFMWLFPVGVFLTVLVGYSVSLVVNYFQKNKQNGAAIK